ncbi:hypothetical protein VNO77_43261 [Canavalia gladiata]|uniref:Uncharacterized protein n=1 Tax=Canavalia gladiata TaxID=3824 RepID=A0AAN9JWG6_CANGL
MFSVVIVEQVDHQVLLTSSQVEDKSDVPSNIGELCEAAVNAYMDGDDVANKGHGEVENDVDLAYVDGDDVRIGSVGPVAETSRIAILTRLAGPTRPLRFAGPTARTSIAIALVNGPPSSATASGVVELSPTLPKPTAIGEIDIS